MAAAGPVSTRHRPQLQAFEHPNSPSLCLEAEPDAVLEGPLNIKGAVFPVSRLKFFLISVMLFDGHSVFNMRVCFISGQCSDSHWRGGNVYNGASRKL